MLAGWFVTALDWRFVLLVWVYSLAMFMLESGVKILVYRMLPSQREVDDPHLIGIEQRFST